MTTQDLPSYALNTTHTSTGMDANKLSSAYISMAPFFPTLSTGEVSSLDGVYNTVTIFLRPIAMAVSLAPAVNLKHCYKTTQIYRA